MRNIRRIGLFSGLFLGLVLLLLQPGSGPAAGQGQTRLVLAFYYAWYNPDSFGPGKTPFQPPEPYFSSDAATIQRHVNQAKGAGIDGFVQSWYGPNEPHTNGNFQTLLDIAAGSGFKAAVDFEPATFMSSNEERAAALSALLSTHANHPAYLRVDGKPVIFFWANWAYSVDAWAAIRNSADPNHNSIWIAEGGNPEYLSVFDGLHLYNTAWAANPAGIASTWSAETRAAAERYGAYKYWVATALPGFDDRHLGRGEETVYRPRSGGAYYQNSFAAAAASSPDMLIITSFNEWAEGSNIEPSVEFGNHYLDLTAEMAAAYKAGGVPDAPPLSQEEPSPSPTTEDAPAPAADTPQPTRPETSDATGFQEPAPSPTAQADGSIVYEVQAGDTLIGIAARFDVELEELYAYNDLTVGSLIRVGQPLIVGYAEGIESETGTPSPSEPVIPEGVEVREDGALVYRVQEGDTLIGIAVQYDLTMEEIYGLNEDLTDESVLSLGQEIVVGQRRQPDSVGSSADVPQPTATTTGVASPSPTATATATITPSPVPSIPPIVPTRAGEVALAGGEAPTPSGDEAAADASMPESESLSGFLPLAAGIVVLLGLSGSILFFLGRRG
ncbi:MAG: endo-1,3-alpha-glucanase family glycosylhydrolase [Candidatus Promineifilaceae bacterium]|nr:endo-1,3-alpha-glucanase family glycosylhydrolase [Candidatus Promineifilaceae bacterium]